MTVTLAHLSDVHLAPLPAFGLRHVNVKRALGWANWALNRHKVHLRSALDAIVADLRAADPDHIIVSGDLCNLGLPAEHAAAARWLKDLGAPARVSVVPGNHDIYCPLGHDPGVERWRSYMAPIAAEGGGAAAGHGFPFVRVLGSIAIVGVNSAIPTRPFSAIGEVGSEQRAALGRVLAELRSRGLFRIVVIHHPPLPGMADMRHGLTDAAAVERVLAEEGADLVLHGHNHRDMHRALSGRHGPTHVLGVGSASVGRPVSPKGGHEQPLARYNLIRFDPQAPHAAEVETRGLLRPGGPVASLSRKNLAWQPYPATLP